MSDLTLRQYQHILPRGQATDITADKELRQYFEGLANTWDDLIGFADDVFDDYYPDTTRELEQWELQFNLQGADALTEQERRDRLIGAWSAVGGQSPRYLQDLFQAQGFDVYIHEWWSSGPNPYVARNPNDYISDSLLPVYTCECGEDLAECGEPEAVCGDSDGPLGKLLVNKITVTEKNLTMLCGEPEAECGESLAEAGQFDTFNFDVLQYEIPNDPDFWPYFLYIGGEVFPNFATVPSARKNEFETLVRKYCPAQQWLGLLVNYA